MNTNLSAIVDPAPFRPAFPLNAVVTRSSDVGKKSRPPNKRRCEKIREIVEAAWYPDPARKAVLGLISAGVNVAEFHAFAYRTKAGRLMDSEWITNTMNELCYVERYARKERI